MTALPTTHARAHAVDHSPEPVRRNVFLLPDEGYVSDGDEIVSAILGTCVAVAFHHPRRRISAIFHARLPQAGPRDTACNAVAHSSGCFRHVDCGIRRILRTFDRLQLPRDELRIQVAGGADGIAPLPGHAGGIGMANTAAALGTLARAGLYPLQVETGGSWGRKVAFLTHSGALRVTTLERGATVRAAARWLWGA